MPVRIDLIVPACFRVCCSNDQEQEAVWASRAWGGAALALHLAKRGGEAELLLLSPTRPNKAPTVRRPGC
eukprot:scaffold213626_cov17-Tisochrysis_lutea.AAC.3